MEHKETTRLDGSVIFLGMKISEQYLLEQQPKGAGWAWRPQKYLEVTSTHTHFYSYTKRSMFKGLCVRAGRITSTREAFKEAVQQYGRLYFYNASKSMGLIFAG